MEGLNNSICRLFMPDYSNSADCKTKIINCSGIGANRISSRHTAVQNNLEERLFGMRRCCPPPCLSLIHISRYDPSELYEMTELKREIKQGIDTLPQNYREIIIMRDICGLTYEEISRSLELEIGTVKSRISREMCIRDRAQDDKYRHNRGIQSS